MHRNFFLKQALFSKNNHCPIIAWFPARLPAGINNIYCYFINTVIEFTINYYLCMVKTTVC